MFSRRRVKSIPAVENEDKFILLSLAEFGSEAKTMLSAAPKSVEIIGGAPFGDSG
jgi:hypothetical protein